ncbi:hypothetical protein J6590_104921, partial [Homalodisca vitripennis]
LHPSISDTLATASLPGRSRHTRSALPASMKATVDKSRRLHRLWLQTRHPVTKRDFSDNIEEHFKANSRIYDEDHCEHVD